MWIMSSVSNSMEKVKDRHDEVPLSDYPRRPRITTAVTRVNLHVYDFYLFSGLSSANVKEVRGPAPLHLQRRVSPPVPPRVGANSAHVLPSPCPKCVTAHFRHHHLAPTARPVPVSASWHSSIQRPRLTALLLFRHPSHRLKSQIFQQTVQMSARR